MKNVKIVVIGGGSSYTPELVDGLIRRWEAGDFFAGEIVLVDLPEGREKAEVVAEFSRRMMKRKGMPSSVRVSLDRSEALDGASFVISQIRVGGMKARRCDEHLPIKYGVIGQETTGPGGFANALRTIPAALEIARDVEEKCPDAWLLNFSNPSGLVTEALIKHAAVKTFGLCNVPISIKMALAQALRIEPEKVRLDVMGLNHLSFVMHIYRDGEDIRDLLFSKAFVALLTKAANLRPEMDRFLTRLKIIPSPYLQYYWLRRRTVSEEERAAKGEGTRADQVMKIEQELFEQYAKPEVDELPGALKKRGGAWYSAVALQCISAILKNSPYLEALNVRNDGAIGELPAGSVVEVTTVVDGKGPTPLQLGPLPVEIRGLVQQVKAYEELTVEAAVHGDIEAAFFALLNHPLVGDAEVALDLLKDILDSNREFLPQFNGKKL